MLIAIAGCTANAWRKQAGTHWRESIETGTEFRHRLFFKPGHGDELHIYIEGDGSIWRNPEQLSPDPTPAQPLMFELAKQDPAPVLLLGRPCYFEVADKQCSPQWWTSARYSAAVVASMDAVAARWATRYQSVMLIGYSGGGSLATLMAAHLPQARALITVAANLDTDAWVGRHRYNADIVGASLNPMRQPPLPPRIAQWHYAGTDDENIAWSWIEQFSARQLGAHFEKIEGFDHRCCWSRRWPALLAPALPDESGRAQNSSR